MKLSILEFGERKEEAGEQMIFQNDAKMMMHNTDAFAMDRMRKIIQTSDVPEVEGQD